MFVGSVQAELAERVSRVAAIEAELKLHDARLEDVHCQHRAMLNEVCMIQSPMWLMSDPLE